MKFSDIPGLSRTKERLLSAVKAKRVAHAWLFKGAEGSAAFPLAWALASYVNCEQPAEDACGVCRVCVKIRKMVHPDVHFFFPMACANESGQKYEHLRTLHMEAWREFMQQRPYADADAWAAFLARERKNLFTGTKMLSIGREEARVMVSSCGLAPYEAAVKIMLVWGVEHMHPGAINAMLKMVEEPLVRTLFFFVSYHEERLLPTLCSRMYPVYVPPFEDKDLTKYVQAHAAIEEAKARSLVRASLGHLDKAMWLARGEVMDMHVLLQEWLRVCWLGDYKQVCVRMDAFHGLDKMTQRALLLYGLRFLREVLLCQVKASGLLSFEDTEHVFVQNFARSISFSTLESIYLAFSEAIEHLTHHANARMRFFALSRMLTQHFGVEKLRRASE